MISMSRMRSVWITNRALCKGKKQLSIAAVNKVHATLFSLTGIDYAYTGVFDSTIISNMKKFNELVDVEKHNICSPNAATDNELTNIQTRINNEMLKEIKKYQFKLYEISKKITTKKKNYPLA